MQVNNKLIATTILGTAQLSGAVYLSAVRYLVPARHIVFVLGAIAYATFANVYIRRTTSSPQPSSRLTDSTNLSPSRGAVRLLFPFTIVLSLLGPTLLMTISSRNDTNASTFGLNAIVAPSLFLILAQTFCETVGFLASTFFIRYVRLGLTIAFVSYRIPVMLSWYRLVVLWARSSEARRLPAYVPALAQATAMLNIVFWSFALLCFLLLYCLPVCLRDPPAVESRERDPVSSQKDS